MCNIADDFINLRATIHSYQDSMQEQLRLLHQIDSHVEFIGEITERYPLNINDADKTKLSEKIRFFDQTVRSFAHENSFSTTPSLHYGTSIVSGVISAYTNDPDAPYVDIYNAYSRINDTERVKSAVFEKLQGIDESIASMFRSCWEHLYVKTDDPVRGPAFEMREVITHMLHRFSNDEQIRKKEWYNSEDGRIKRSDRIRFIVEEKINENVDPDIVKNALEDLEENYNKFNRAHTHGEINIDKIKPLFSHTQDLINAILDQIHI